MPGPSLVGDCAQETTEQDRDFDASLEDSSALEDKEVIGASLSIDEDAIKEINEDEEDTDSGSDSEDSSEEENSEEPSDILSPDSGRLFNPSQSQLREAEEQLELYKEDALKNMSSLSNLVVEIEKIRTRFLENFKEECGNELRDLNGQLEGFTANEEELVHRQNILNEKLGIYKHLLSLCYGEVREEHLQLFGKPEFLKEMHKILSLLVIKNQEIDASGSDKDFALLAKAAKAKNLTRKIISKTAALAARIFQNEESQLFISEVTSILGHSLREVSGEVEKTSEAITDLQGKIAKITKVIAGLTLEDLPEAVIQNLEDELRPLKDLQKGYRSIRWELDDKIRETSEKINLIKEAGIKQKEIINDGDKPSASSAVELVEVAKVISAPKVNPVLSRQSEPIITNELQEFNEYDQAISLLTARIEAGPTFNSERTEALFKLAGKLGELKELLKKYLLEDKEGADATFAERSRFLQEHIEPLAEQITMLPVFKKYIALRLQKGVLAVNFKVKDLLVVHTVTLQELSREMQSLKAEAPGRISEKESLEEEENGVAAATGQESCVKSFFPLESQLEGQLETGGVATDYSLKEQIETSLIDDESAYFSTTVEVDGSKENIALEYAKEAEPEPERFSEVTEQIESLIWRAGTKQESLEPASHKAVTHLWSRTSEGTPYPQESGPSLASHTISGDDTSDAMIDPSSPLPEKIMEDEPEMQREVQSQAAIQHVPGNEAPLLSGPASKSPPDSQVFKSASLSQGVQGAIKVAESVPQSIVPDRSTGRGMIISMPHAVSAQDQVIRMEDSKSYDVIIETNFQKPDSLKQIVPAGANIFKIENLSKGNHSGISPINSITQNIREILRPSGLVTVKTSASSLKDLQAIAEHPARPTNGVQLFLQYYEYLRRKIVQQSGILIEETIEEETLTIPGTDC